MSYPTDGLRRVARALPEFRDEAAFELFGEMAPEPQAGVAPSKLALDALGVAPELSARFGDGEQGLCRS